MLMTLLNPAWAADFDLDFEQLNELSPAPGSVINAANLADFGAFIDRDFAHSIASPNVAQTCCF
jgi:hypothetical protein